MIDFNNLSAYENCIYQGLLNSNFAEDEAIPELFQKYYPIKKNNATSFKPN